MQKQTGSWLRAAEKHKTLNCLTSLTHENFETNLCKTGHNFYSIKHPQLKDWNSYREVPKNYHIYNTENGPWHKNFDFVIVQACFGQDKFLVPLAAKMGVPLIRIEHTSALHLHPEQIKYSQTIVGNVNIFIGEDQVKQWGMEKSNYKIIKHAVSDDFSPSRKPSENKHILSIVNDFIGRGSILGFDLWKNLVHNLPFRIRGDSKGLSKPTSSLKELVNEYRNARVFLNTSYSSPIPSVMLEAMACGIPVVSTKNCSIPEYFTHEYDSFLSNDPKELRKYLELLLNDKKLADEMGENARKTAKEKLSMGRFINEWNEIFEQARLK